MALSEKISVLIIENVDFKNDALEAATEKLITKTFDLASASNAVEQAAGGDESVLQVAEGVVTLAKTFGTAFRKLDDNQKTEVSNAVKSVVTGANEQAIESLFDACLETITAAQELNEVADTPDEEGDE